MTRFAKELRLLLKDFGLKGSAWFVEASNDDSRKFRKWKSGADVPNDDSWIVLEAAIRGMATGTNLGERLAELGKLRKEASERGLGRQKRAAGQRGKNRSEPHRAPYGERECETSRKTREVLGRYQNASDSGLATSIPLRATRGVDKSNPKFILSVDGIILNSVGELIFERADEKTIWECGASYERALEDFGFATVYGSQLRARWSPLSKTTERVREPAELLIESLPKGIYEQEVLDQDLSSKTVLQDKDNRDTVRNYIRSMGSCMSERPFLRWCRDWLVRESATYLGTDASLFKTAKDPNEYRFGKEYYRDTLLEEIPGLLEQTQLATLINFVPKTPPAEHGKRGADRYADGARTRFVLETVLTQITTMYQFEKHAERNRQWRVPYGLRAEITRESTRAQFQGLLKRILLGHALKFALRKISVSDGRIAVVRMLSMMRTISPFAEIREMLQELGVLRPDLNTEQKSEKLIQDIYKAGRDGKDAPRDPVSLARSSVLRELAETDPDDYKVRLYAVFPELSKSSKGHADRY